MRYIQLATLMLLIALAAGCTNYKTKFNRGYYEIPGDAQKMLVHDMDKFRTIDEDISRRANRSYEKTVDLTYDVMRWTEQEWTGAKESANWTVVQIGKELSVIAEAGQYIKRRWERFGPKVKGLWTDSFKFIEHEINVVSELDDDAARLLRNEMERVGTADAGLKRWVRNRSEEFSGFSEFVRRMYSRETEKGEDALQSVKDYFTKKIK